MNLIFLTVLGCAGRPPALAPPDIPDLLDLRGAGRELFVRTWVANDPRAAPGDGLGPIANASSCAACHNQGGVGGAGSEARNAPITVRGRQVQRNPPALFGAGMIDGILDDAILEAAAAIHTDADLSGRVGVDADGRIARFGWKGDVDRLATFVGRACSVELGLEVPGFAQRPTLDTPDAPGFDLDHRGLNALIRFVATLPSPQVLATPGVDHGREVFSDAGCDGCHQENLGTARGLYSDLLLHNLGPKLAEAGGYYGLTVRTAANGASPEEWRTPPLWGLRDSAPYLHDGRAKTVESAIRAHEGEADATRARYIRLPAADQAALLSFLDSLAAPG